MQPGLVVWVSCDVSTWRSLVDCCRQLDMEVTGHTRDLGSSTWNECLRWWSSILWCLWDTGWEVYVCWGSGTTVLPCSASRSAMFVFPSVMCHFVQCLFSCIYVSKTGNKNYNTACSASLKLAVLYSVLLHFMNISCIFLMILLAVSRFDYILLFWLVS